MPIRFKHYSNAHYTFKIKQLNKLDFQNQDPRYFGQQQFPDGLFFKHVTKVTQIDNFLQVPHSLVQLFTHLSKEIKQIKIFTCSFEIIEKQIVPGSIP